MDLLRWRARARLALLAALVGLGCGPVKSTSLLVDAAAELAAAQTAQAEALSPYELIAAEAYLHKAREEQSYADFEVAQQLAVRSRDCARVARMRAERAVRQGLGAEAAANEVPARCLAGPPGARPPQGLEAPLPSPLPSPAPSVAPAPDAAKAPAPPAKAPPAGKKRSESEPTDPLPEGE